MFDETISVIHKKRAGKPNISTEELITDVHDRMKRHPTNSLQCLSRENTVSYEHPESYFKLKLGQATI